MSSKKISAYKRIGWWLDQNGLNIIIILLVLFFVVVFFWKKIFIIVPAGHSAVLYQPFDGGTQKELYEEGLHIIAPWDEMSIYDTRLQMTVDTVKAQTKQGLPVDLVFAARYILKREKLFEVQRFIGPDYEKKIVLPEAIAKLRDLLSSQSPTNLYGVTESSLESEFLESVKKEIGENVIMFEDIKILRVIIPKNYEVAVTQNHVQEEKSKEYEHIIEQANRELQRKKLDAMGIADFERISGISYLKYRSIQATEALSISPNAKVIVVGNGNKEIPVLLSDK